MKTIVLASSNKHKISEFKQILNDVELLSLDDISFIDEIEETGETFLDNALIKAREVSKFLQSRNLDYDIIAEDSGLCCTSINLEPGVYSARYAGGHGNDRANRNKLIENLKGKDKTAYFTAFIVLYHFDGSYEFKEGRTYGKIIEEEIGDTSFGYDCIFLSDDLGKTFGSATSDEKNSVSHRYRALEQIRELL